jgi:hypothetical protein
MFEPFENYDKAVEDICGPSFVCMYVDKHQNI